MILKKLYMATLYLALFSVQLFAQPDLNQINTRAKAPLIYAHAGISLGMDWYTSKDIEDLFANDYKVQNLEFPFSVYVISGFDHYVQIEYKSSGGEHGIGKLTSAPAGSGSFFATEHIKMKMKYQDLIIKVNPFFWHPRYTGAGGHDIFFLTYGQGKIDHLDKNNDGFKGRSNIYGVELDYIIKFLSIQFNLRYYDYSLDKFILQGVTYKMNLKSSDYQFNAGIGIGLGM